VSVRKQLKEAAKALKASTDVDGKYRTSQTVPGWELTVGIEIHAQLNTAKKLFSPAANSFDTEPNVNVALFDVAIPGSQPLFQHETLVPALRAALSLNCDIQPVSRWDRKHYTHWDQPSGYQITQFYEPFAKDGHIILQKEDGIAGEDGDSLRVDIKQIQMEQDTAKTITNAGGEHWVDFNRAGAPLIEIITLPHIHYPRSAAALVRKIQRLLNTVDACVSGMEEGGLRADVNVSVRRTNDPNAPLGTRVEIKNLSSFKAVEAAVIAERNRQIKELQNGGHIAAETRGWTAAGSERLRGKEGEVDYRYMPDPDLAPVVIGDDLLKHLKKSLPMLPDDEASDLVRHFGFNRKDADSLMQLEGGGRVQFYHRVVAALEKRLERERQNESGSLQQQPGNANMAARVLAGNWILHKLGSLTGERNAQDGMPNDLEMKANGDCRIEVDDLADILLHLHQKRITAGTAKELLFAVFRGDLAVANAPYKDIADMIDQEDLWFDEIATEDYVRLAEQAIDDNASVLDAFRSPKKYPTGKLMFLVSKMIRLGPEGRMDPEKAAGLMKASIESRVAREAPS
jgi:aspartyl-tRNA(Asn)/glutamyl-tRNA(Gln) amidotransferase subunit B